MIRAVAAKAPSHAKLRKALRRPISFHTETLGQGDIYVTTTGNKDVLTLDHLKAMKDQAIVCNIVSRSMR